MNKTDTHVVIISSWATLCLRCDETPQRIHRMHRTPNNAVTEHDSV